MENVALIVSWFLLLLSGDLEANAADTLLPSDLRICRLSAKRLGRSGTVFLFLLLSSLFHLPEFLRPRLNPENSQAGAAYPPGNATDAGGWEEDETG